MIRIVILMGKEQERSYFEALLTRRSGFQVVGAGRDGFDAITLVQHHQPDIALIDENLPFLDRGNIITSMLFWARETRIIMMAANAGGTSATVLRAISAGAAGYFGRLADREAIFRGIALVMQGGSMMSPETAALAFRSFPHPKGRLEASGTTSTIPNRTAPARAPHMNRQELRLLSCIGRGLSGSEISRTLQLTEGTIRNYLSSIYSKTGMRNRAEVALFARQVGLSGMD